MNKNLPFESDTVQDGYVIYKHGRLLSHSEVEELLNEYWRMFQSIGRYFERKNLLLGKETAINISSKER